jgi:hypothetical protein
VQRQAGDSGAPSFYDEVQDNPLEFSWQNVTPPKGPDEDESISLKDQATESRQVDPGERTSGN